MTDTTAVDAEVQADIDALSPAERAELHADCEHELAAYPEASPEQRQAAQRADRAFAEMIRTSE